MTTNTSDSLEMNGFVAWDFTTVSRESALDNLARDSRKDCLLGLQELYALAHKRIQDELKTSDKERNIRLPSFEHSIDSPFQENARDDNMQLRLREYLIRLVDKNESIIHRDAISKRLRELSIPDPSEPEDDVPSQRSLKRFVEFLQHYPNVSIPAIGVGPNRNVLVEWRESSTKKLVIEFLEDGRIIFALFLPVTRGQPPVKRVSGVSCPAAVLNDLKGFNLNEWIGGC